MKFEEKWNDDFKVIKTDTERGLQGFEKLCACRCFSLLLITAIFCHGETIEMECGFIEKTDRGLQCEFNNIFTFNSSQVVVIESNKSIDAVSFRQSELFSVPADLFRNFPRLKHLDVELSQLKVITADNFRNANDLKYFLARFNDISELKNGIFDFCPQLKFIVLQYNEISHIESNAFTGIVNLEALYLDYNKMTTLPSRVLDPLVNLVHFSMAFNNLTNIPDDLFAINDKLETLNLGHNLLLSFNDRQFENLPNLERVQLDHNNLKRLNLRTCKSTEINIDSNEIETLELNKWTRFVSAWKNPVKNFILNEHYGTGRSYNFSFAAVTEITFFVNEHCCTVENLENFGVLIQSFGDLSQKQFDEHDWRCKFLKSIGYQTPTGLVVNNICTKISSQSIFTASDFPSLSSEETTTTEIFTQTTLKSTRMIINQEDLIDSDERETSTKPRESIEEDSSLATNIFTGMNIETLEEKRTTTAAPLSYTANVQEFFPATTEESYEEKCEKGILKTVKKKVGGWKDKVVKKWNDWVG